MDATEPHFAGIPILTRCFRTVILHPFAVCSLIVGTLAAIRFV